MKNLLRTVRILLAFVIVMLIFFKLIMLLLVAIGWTPGEGAASIND